MSKIENTSYIYFNENQIKKSNEKDKNNKTISKSFESKTKFSDLIAEIEIDSTQIKDRSKIEEEIALLQKNLGIQGEILKKSKNINDLDLYKKNVKKYINTVVSLTEKAEKKDLRNWHKKAKETKVHLSIIDKELYELTKEFIKEQRNVLFIASKIDKIEGILIDLFS